MRRGTGRGAAGQEAGGTRLLKQRAGAGPTKLVRPRQPRPSPGRAEDGSPRRRGCRRLNHLSLCSPQLSGSGQLKMSSHCLSAQMLAPPPPGLPRLALPPATKPTSAGGSTSPSSPCKHSGKRCPWQGGRPRGPPPPRLLGPGGCRRVWCVHRRPGGATGPGPRGVRAALGSSRGKSAAGPSAERPGVAVRPLWALSPPPAREQRARPVKVPTAARRPDPRVPCVEGESLVVVLKSRHFT